MSDDTLDLPPLPEDYSWNVVPRHIGLTEVFLTRRFEHGVRVVASGIAYVYDENDKPIPVRPADIQAETERQLRWHFGGQS